MGANRILRGTAIFGTATVLVVAGMQIATASPAGTSSSERATVSSRDSADSADSAKKKGKRGLRGKRGPMGKTGPQGPRGVPGPAGTSAFVGAVTGDGMPTIGLVPVVAGSYVPFGVSTSTDPGYAVATAPMTINKFQLAVVGQVTTDRTWVLWKANGDFKTGVEYVACTIPAAVLADPAAVATCTAPALSIAAGQAYAIEYVSGPLTSNPTWTYSVS